MSVAIAEVLSKFDFQILWKFNKMGEYPDAGLLPLKPYLDSDRMRMPNWLIADPSSSSTVDLTAITRPLRESALAIVTTSLLTYEQRRSPSSHPSTLG
jgi:hypothetical protein